MGYRFFTRFLNRPAGQPLSYYDTKRLCLYISPRDGSRQCPDAEPKLSHAITRLNFRFHSITGHKPLREIPVFIENNGRTLQLQNVAVNHADNG